MYQGFIPTEYFEKKPHLQSRFEKNEEPRGFISNGSKIPVSSRDIYFRWLGVLIRIAGTIRRVAVGDEDCRCTGWGRGSSWINLINFSML